MTDPASNPNPNPGSTPGADPGHPTPPPASSAGGHYDLVPEDPTPRPSATPQLNVAGLTDDFDEDADFEYDPATAPKAPKPKPAPTDTFVKSGFGSAQVVGTLGVVAYVGGAIYAAVAWRDTTWWMKTLVLYVYQGGLQVVAGVVAVVFAARMAEKPLGSLELAAARMLLAVSVARALMPVPIPVPYVDKLLLGVLVLGSYAALTWGLFRLNKHHWLVMVAAHTGLVIVLWLGGAIESWARTVDTVLPR